MATEGRWGARGKGGGAARQEQSRGTAGLGPSNGLQASGQRGVSPAAQEGRLPTFPTAPARPRASSHPSGSRLRSNLAGGPWRTAATRSEAISETS